MRNIQEALEEHKKAVLAEGIPESQLLGIFLYGSQNYGIDTEKSDVDTKAIFIPTVEQAILEKKPLVKELYLSNGEHCELMDIRHLVDNFRKQNINFIEILFTKHYWLNPDYYEQWVEYFVDKRDQIARYDMRRAVESITGQALHTLGQNRFNGKKIANVWRLTDFLDKYTKGAPYEECLTLPMGTTEAIKMMKKRIEPIEGDELQARLEVCIETIRKNFLDDAIKSAEYNPAAIDINMDNGIIALIRKEDLYE